MTWRVDQNAAEGFIALSLDGGPPLRLTPHDAGELSLALRAAAETYARRRGAYLLKQRRAEHPPLPEGEPPGQPPPL